MQVGIYYNKNYVSAQLRCFEGICKFLTDNFGGYNIVENENALNDVDFLIVLGGDGTILNIAAECAKRNIPIMGINYGHVGFLAEFEQDKWQEAMQMLMDKQYQIQNRSMLKIQIGEKTYFALNDLVLQRSTSGNAFCNTVSISAEINDCLVDKYVGDGIIISTPTGSTAYSLSAGGSVLTPDINAFIMSPICAHSLHSRPIVYQDAAKLRLKLLSNAVINFVVDGIRVVPEEKCNEVIVTKAEHYVQFVSAKDSDFFHKLLFKLNKWSK